MLLCYVGMRQGRKDKRTYLWVEVSGLDDRPSVDEGAHVYRVWSKPVQRGAMPGATYKMQVSYSDSGGLLLTPDSGTYVGLLEDSATVAQWQLRHKAASAALTANSKAKQELKRRLDLKRLEPLRSAYRYAPRSEKHHILAEIICYVTGGTL